MANKNEVAVEAVVSIETLAKEINENPTLNKSQKIRAMAALPMKRGDIAKLMNIRYQHVRNVLITPVKKA